MDRLATGILALLWTVLFPVFSCTSSSVPPLPDTGNPASHFAALDGRALHYLDVGTGEPTLVLVHGWASDHRVWRPQVEDLGSDHRLVVLDLPGHGFSAEPAVPYSMDLFAEGIAAVLDDAGVDSAVLVGHSNGVPAVRQFYRRHPRRVRGMVLVDGALRAMFDAQAATGYLARFEGESWRSEVEGMVRSMPAFDLGADERNAILEMALAQPQDAVAGGLRAAIDPSIWREDPIDVPVLMILAAQPAWTAEYESFVRGLVPKLDYRVWDGVSHFLMVERPREFDAAVREFAGGLP